MPDLDFVVEGAEVALHSVSPLLLFKLRVSNTKTPNTQNAADEIVSLALHCQIQIEATRRSYEPVDQARELQAAGRPQLRIHADGREAGNRVHFVEVQDSGVAGEQKIDARHACPVDGFEGGD